MALPTNPCPLGRIRPGATFATTAVLAIQNLITLTYIQSTPADCRFKDLVIQANKDNLLPIYITNDASAPAADYSNVLRRLQPGETYVAPATSTIAADPVDGLAFYVAAGNATDFAIGEVREG